MHPRSRAALATGFLVLVSLAPSAAAECHLTCDHVHADALPLLALAAAGSLFAATTALAMRWR